MYSEVYSQDSERQGDLVLLSGRLTEWLEAHFSGSCCTCITYCATASAQLRLPFLFRILTSEFGYLIGKELLALARLAWLPSAQESGLKPLGAVFASRHTQSSQGRNSLIAEPVELDSIQSVRVWALVSARTGDKGSMAALLLRQLTHWLLKSGLSPSRKPLWKSWGRLASAGASEAVLLSRQELPWSQSQLHLQVLDIICEPRTACPDLRITCVQPNPICCLQIYWCWQASSSTCRQLP